MEELPSPAVAPTKPRAAKPRRARVGLGNFVSRLVRSAPGFQYALVRFFQSSLVLNFWCFSTSPWWVPGSSNRRSLCCMSRDSFATGFQAQDTLLSASRECPTNGEIPLVLLRQGIHNRRMQALWAGMICTKSAHVSGPASCLASLITLPSPTPGPSTSHSSLFPLLPSGAVHSSGAAWLLTISRLAAVASAGSTYSYTPFAFAPGVAIYDSQFSP